jgi:RNA polymerase sigma-70 factor (ECF subfamily)
MLADKFLRLFAASGVLGINIDTPVQTLSTKLTDSAEFALFMHAYQDMVFSTAARLCGNDAQAQDIAQEVFLKAYQNFAHLRDNPTAGGWLKTVAARLTLNHLSRYRRRWRFFSELDNDDSGEEAPLPQLTIADSVAANIDADTRAMRVEQALRELPEHQRVPLVLFHFEEMPYQEIAKRLHVSLPKVKTDIQRGRATLAKILVRSGVVTAGFEQ